MPYLPKNWSLTGLLSLPKTQAVTLPLNYLLCSCHSDAIPTPPPATETCLNPPSSIELCLTIVPFPSLPLWNYLFMHIKL